MIESTKNCIIYYQKTEDKNKNPLVPQKLDSYDINFKIVIK